MDLFIAEIVTSVTLVVSFATGIAAAVKGWLNKRRGVLGIVKKFQRAVNEQLPNGGDSSHDRIVLVDARTSVLEREIKELRRAQITQDEKRREDVRAIHTKIETAGAATHERLDNLLAALIIRGDIKQDA